MDAFIQERGRLIEEALSRVLIPVEPRPLYEAMRYALLSPGKRLRPLLCLGGCEAVGGEIANAIPAACAIEMVHAMSLVHDDLPALDNDELRRGQPTCHRKFGEALAILAGDALLAHAFTVMVEASHNIEPKRLVWAIAELAEAAGPKGIAGGQVQDILSAGASAIGQETVDFIHKHKTGRLMAASAAIGGIVGGGNAEEVSRLKEFGLELGLAFQILDDVADVTCSQEELGKTPGKDAKAGKATYPALFGVEASKSLAREIIQRAVQSLEIFGSKAGTLHAIAGVIAKTAQVSGRLRI